MNFKQLNEQLQKFIINEMSITKANSGKISKIGFDINTFIDDCFDRYNSNFRDIPFGIFTDLNIKGISPQNTQQNIDVPLTLLYGSKYFGIRHIIEQREGEFNNKQKTEILNEHKVELYLKEIPQALRQGKCLLDFDVTEKPYKQYTDRLIFYYKELFYVFILQSNDVFCNCILTMFKPKTKYKQLILKLNENLRN